MSLTILVLLSASAAPLGVASRPSYPQSMIFVCAEQKVLRVEVHKESAAVQTALATYRLPRKKSSIGQRFVSNQAAFAVDEDRGVFVAGTEGPYRRCRLASGGQRL